MRIAIRHLTCEVPSARTGDDRPWLLMSHRPQSGEGGAPEVVPSTMHPKVATGMTLKPRQVVLRRVPSSVLVELVERPSLWTQTAACRCSETCCTCPGRSTTLDEAAPVLPAGHGGGTAAAGTRNAAGAVERPGSSLGQPDRFAARPATSTSRARCQDHRAACRHTARHWLSCAWLEN